MRSAEDNTSSREVGLLLWRQFSWRHARRSPRSSLVLIAILALGVAAVFSIRLANRAALEGFGYFSQNLTGGSDLAVRSPSGDLDEAALSRIRAELGELPVAAFPLMEATAALLHSDDEPPVGEDRSTLNANAPLLRFTGVDLVGIRNAVYLSAPSARPTASLIRLDETGENADLGSSDQVYIAAGLAERHGFAIGDVLRVAIDARPVDLNITGILENDPTQPEVPANLVLLDLPGLQTLLGAERRITRIELRVPAGQDREQHVDAMLQRVEPMATEEGWLLETPDQRAESSAKMTAAFRLNLTILSTLALLVGIYLVLQALEAAVVRRRREIAILRSLGVAARQIRRAWLIEALALGIVGTALGLVIGWGAAQLTVGNIAKTVSALYFETTTRAAAWHHGEALFAGSFGIAASILAGWLPARDAATTPPVQSLREGGRHAGPRWLRRPALGFVLIVAGWLLCQLPPWSPTTGYRVPVGGYLAALAWVAGLSILCGQLFRPMARLTAGRQENSAVKRYAASQLRRPSGRHRLTAAGLVAAVGMAAGMGILVHSFEGTLSGWIRQLLKADLYVAPAGVGSASSDATLDRELWQSLVNDPDVAAADVIRRYPLVYDGRPTILAGSEYARHDRSLRLSWSEAPDDPDPRSLEQNLASGRTPAWISESFGLRFGKTRGDILHLPTPDGEKAVEITGVYIDYHNESGTVLLNRRFTRAWFGDDTAISNAAIFLHTDSDAAVVRDRWQQTFPGLVVRTNARLRDEALRVFHQTFAVTHALEAIGITVAIAGLALTLASLMIERRGEIATLSRLGMTRNQLSRATALESLGIATAGTLAGLLLSLALGYVLIYIVNRQSFGWTLQFGIPWKSMAALAAATLATSAIVGYVIGRHAPSAPATTET